MRHLREPANGLIHLVGALLAVVALALLLRLAAGAGTARHVVAYGVFGLSLVALYTSSCAGYFAYPLRLLVRRPLSRRGDSRGAGHPGRGWR